MQHTQPTIFKQNGKKSVGKGFSINELKQAEVSKQRARQIGLPVDVKRKTAHTQNVDAIKAHQQKAKTAEDAKPQTAKNKSVHKEKAKSKKP
jgi:ribosomal protein L13E